MSFYKDYETPNFITPPKKDFISSKSAVKSTSKDFTTCNLSDVDAKINEFVYESLKNGQNEKVEILKERALKEIIINLKGKIDILLKEQEKLIKIIHENLEEKIKMKNNCILKETMQNDNQENIECENDLKRKNEELTQKIKKYKGKLEIIYFKYKKLEKEKEEILIEKFRLEERNKKYYEETLSLQNLEGEMQCFENKVYTKQIIQLETQLNILEKENERLKAQQQQKMKTSNLSSNLLIEENYFKNIQYSPVSNERPYFDQKIEKLLRENGDLVSSLQNAIDYMNSIKIPGEDLKNNNTFDTSEILKKMDILLKENEKLKNGLKDLLEQKKIDDQKKDNIITELKEKQPYKLEINNDGLHETLKELENKIKDLKKEDNNKNDNKDYIKIHELELINQKQQLIISNLEEKLQIKTKELDNNNNKLLTYEENEKKLKKELQDEISKYQLLYTKLKEGNKDFSTIDMENEILFKKQLQQKDILIDSLKLNIKDLERELEKIKKEQILINESYEGKMKNLLYNEDNFSVKDRKIKNLEIEIKNLNEKIQDYENEQNKLNNKVSNFKQKNEELEEINNQLKKNKNSNDESKYFNEKEKEIQIIKEELQKISIELAIEQETKEELLNKMDELEKILKFVFKEGENYKNEINETVVQESQKMIVKFQKLTNKM